MRIRHYSSPGNFRGEVLGGCEERKNLNGKRVPRLETPGLLSKILSSPQSPAVACSVTSRSPQDETEQFYLNKSPAGIFLKPVSKTHGERLEKETVSQNNKSVEMDAEARSKRQFCLRDSFSLNLE
jgi:hypothetical protein